MEISRYLFVLYEEKVIYEFLLTGNKILVYKYRFSLLPAQERQGAAYDDRIAQFHSLILVRPAHVRGTEAHKIDPGLTIVARRLTFFCT